MKLRSYVLAAWGLMVFVGYSYGACLPQWSPGPNSGCPDCICEGPLTLEQMGHFQADGTWVYDSMYLDQMSWWGPYTAYTNPEVWEPRKVFNISPNPMWGQNQLQVVHKETGVTTRAYMQLPSWAIVYPEVYRWLYPNGSFHGFVANFQAPEGCVPPWTPMGCSGPPNDSDPNPCCHPWTIPQMTQSILAAVAFDEIESVCWYQGEVLKSCADHTRPDLFFTIKESRMPINYDYQKPVQGNNPPNYSPVRQQYAYWTMMNPLFRVKDFTAMFAYFSGPPDPDIPSKLVIKVDGYDYPINILGGDVSKPPLIPTKIQISGDKVNKKGKVKDKEIAVSTANIVASEVDGNLVIQWGEAILLEPYWQVFVLIGNSCGVGNHLLLSCSGDTMVYASVEVPYPAASAVLPAAAWSALKDEIRAKGESSARISVFYRRTYQNATPGGGMLQVRSQSNYIEFPF